MTQEQNEAMNQAIDLLINNDTVVIPYSFIKNTDNKVALEFSDTKCLDVENETKKPDTYKGSRAACQKTMPIIIKI